MSIVQARECTFWRAPPLLPHTHTQRIPRLSQAPASDEFHDFWCKTRQKNLEIPWTCNLGLNSQTSRDLKYRDWFSYLQKFRNLSRLHPEVPCWIGEHKSIVILDFERSSTRKRTCTRMPNICSQPRWNNHAHRQSSPKSLTSVQSVISQTRDTKSYACKPYRWQNWGDQVLNRCCWHPVDRESRCIHAVWCLRHAQRRHLRGCGHLRNKDPLRYWYCA